MTTFTLTTNGESYALPPGHDLRRLKQNLSRAAHEDGRFVAIISGGRVVYLLITAHSATRIEEALTVVASRDKNRDSDFEMSYSGWLEDFGG